MTSPDSASNSLSSQVNYMSPSTPRSASLDLCRESFEVREAERRGAWLKTHRNRVMRPLSTSYHKYLEDAGAFQPLPRCTADVLLPLYNSYLNDLIPIVDGTHIFRKYSNGTASVYLVRAMCLVVCKVRAAASSLRLSNGGSILEPSNFASRILAGLEAAMKADLEPDRIVKVQVLALMHLHNDGKGGVERASKNLSQAIHEAWALSLHHNIAGNPDERQCSLLWWSLRNFDRLNKPIRGFAPFIIDDTDVGIARVKPRTGDYRSELMTVALRLGDLLVKATRVYKASSRAVTDDCHEIPSLDEIFDAAHANNFHSSHRGYFEAWYHLAAMLSCRFSGPNTALYQRRLASADRLREMFSEGKHEQLPPLPLIPYAISMATTVIYRALRDGVRQQDSAVTHLRDCSMILEQLGEHWTSVRFMARLVKNLFRATDFDTRTTEVENNGDIVGSYIERSTNDNELSVPGRHVEPASTQVTVAIPTAQESLGQNCHQGTDVIDTTNSSTMWQAIINQDIGSAGLGFDPDRIFGSLFEPGMSEVFEEHSGWDSMIDDVPSGMNQMF